jgi:hypothetical protein
LERRQAHSSARQQFSFVAHGVARSRLLLNQVAGDGAGVALGPDPASARPLVRGRGSERWAADALVVLTRESQVEVVVAYGSDAIASRIAANTPVGTLSQSALCRAGAREVRMAAVLRKKVSAPGVGWSHRTSGIEFAQGRSRRALFRIVTGIQQRAVGLHELSEFVPCGS